MAIQHPPHDVPALRRRRAHAACRRPGDHRRRDRHHRRHADARAAAALPGRRGAAADGPARRVAVPSRQLQPRGRRPLRVALPEPDDEHALQPFHAAARSRLSDGMLLAARAASTSIASRRCRRWAASTCRSSAAAARLLSQAIKGVVEVGWSDMLVHYRLVRLQVEGLGPATVGIDAHGRSLYAEEQQSAKARIPELLAQLDAARTRSARVDERRIGNIDE